MKTIAITGSSGNLGTKLTSFLVEKKWCEKRKINLKYFFPKKKFFIIYTLYEFYADYYYYYYNQALA